MALAPAVGYLVAMKTSSGRERTRGPATDSDVAATAPELPAEHALLGLLKLAGGTAHGYELARQFRRGLPLGDIIHLEQAMLYKHLKKLARLGWITTSLKDQPPRPPRHLCHLTPAGEAELRRWLAAPVARTREIRLEFLVKLYFAWQLDPAQALHLASEQRDVVHKLAESIASQLEQTSREPGHEDFGGMVLRLRLAQTRSAAHWLEQVAQAAQRAADQPARST